LPSEHPDEPDEVRPGLPAATQASFEKHFERQRIIRPSLVAASGTYVVLDPPLQRALTLVREMQQAPPAQRLAFVRSPQTFLREALEDELDADVLEGLFHDEGYSERVQEVGIWVPKILPWLQSNERREWIPGEPLGLQVGDARLRIHPDQLDALAEAIEAAAQAGHARLMFDGQEWPVCEESLEAIEQLRAEVSRRKGGGRRDSDPEADHRLVLIIEDNLEHDAYSASWRPRSDLPRGSPERLKAALYPHQRDALSWLQSHWLSGSPGALLADDMGLGKTIQSLAFLAWLAEYRKSRRVPDRPFLLVAPTGLLVNWEQEADRHLELGALGHVIRAHGSELRCMRVSKHKELKAGLPALDLDRLRTAGWVLTTYETLRDYQHSFGKVRWLAAVFDEVQKIKNPAAAMTHAAKAMQIDFCLTMTGTPVENRLSDAWCIIDRAQPGLLGENKEFVQRYERGGEDAPRELSAKLSNSPGDGKPPVMLRRIKADHLKGLPEMCVHRHERSMPQPQAAAYANAVALAQASAGEKGAMLRALAELKTISLHPSLEALEEDEAFIGASARLAAAFEVLDGVAARGEKALVFIETLDMQTALLPLLRRRYGLPWLPHVISGRIPGRKRQALVESFQDRSGFDVMLLSPKAGGVGLTLTAANHVVHLSRWWNPAVEDQCSDRVHRIGQDRTVHVHLPLAVHPELGERSFDLKLDALLEGKRGLSRQVLMPALFTKDDAASMFTETVGGTSSP